MYKFYYYELSDGNAFQVINGDDGENQPSPLWFTGGSLVEQTNFSFISLNDETLITQVSNSSYGLNFYLFLETINGDGDSYWSVWQPRNFECVGGLNYEVTYDINPLLTVFANLGLGEAGWETFLNLYGNIEVATIKRCRRNTNCRNHIPQHLKPDFQNKKVFWWNEKKIREIYKFPEPEGDDPSTGYPNWNQVYQGQWTGQDEKPIFGVTTYPPNLLKTYAYATIKVWDKYVSNNTINPTQYGIFNFFQILPVVTNPNSTNWDALSPNLSLSVRDIMAFCGDELMNVMLLPWSWTYLTNAQIIGPNLSTTYQALTGNSQPQGQETNSTPSTPEWANGSLKLRSEPAGIPEHSFYDESGAKVLSCQYTNAPLQPLMSMENWIKVRNFVSVDDVGTIGDFISGRETGVITTLSELMPSYNINLYWPWRFWCYLEPMLINYIQEYWVINGKKTPVNSNLVIENYGYYPWIYTMSHFAWSLNVNFPSVNLEILPTWANYPWFNTDGIWNPFEPRQNTYNNILISDIQIFITTTTNADAEFLKTYRNQINTSKKMLNETITTQIMNSFLGNAGNLASSLKNADFGGLGSVGTSLATLGIDITKERQQYAMNWGWEKQNTLSMQQNVESGNSDALYTQNLGLSFVIESPSNFQLCQVLNYIYYYGYGVNQMGYLKNWVDGVNFTYIQGDFDLGGNIAANPVFAEMSNYPITKSFLNLFRQQLKKGVRLWHNANNVYFQSFERFLSDPNGGPTDYIENVPYSTDENDWAVYPPWWDTGFDPTEHNSESEEQEIEKWVKKLWNYIHPTVTETNNTK